MILSNYEKETTSIAEKNNPSMIEQYSGVSVLGVVPHMENPGSRDQVLSVIEQSIEWSKLAL
ncbi:hypothetical protein D3C84_1265660 [compost metagenome]